MAKTKEMTDKEGWKWEEGNWRTEEGLWRWEEDIEKREKKCTGISPKPKPFYFPPGKSGKTKYIGDNAGWESELAGWDVELQKWEKDLRGREKELEKQGC